MATQTTDPLAITHLGEGALSFRRPIISAPADRTLHIEESGSIVIADADGVTITLPSAAITGPSGVVKGGWEFYIVNGGADGAYLVKVDPNGTDQIHGEVPNAAADSVASGVAGKYFGNTKSTAKTGDFIHVVSDGGDRVYIVGGKGIWASEA